MRRNAVSGGLPRRQPAGQTVRLNNDALGEEGVGNLNNDALGEEGVGNPTRACRLTCWDSWDRHRPRGAPR
jgi:hypothetical protein